MKNPFFGKLALITGGASGIGAALAQELANRGARVLLADRQLELAQSVAAQMPGAAAFELDVRDLSAWQALMDQITAQFGQIDFLFNNAGIAIGAEVQSMGRDEWQDIIDVNVSGVANGIQAVYPAMVRQGAGHIINTASMAGLTVNPGVTAYSMTKFAVVGLSLSLRAEAADLGVRVSALCPGVIRTPILDGGKYGRIHGYNKNAVDRLWKVVRPMAADRFAVQVLDEVARNRAIIVVPKAWKLAWWLGRLSPSLQADLTRFAIRHSRRTMREK